MDEKVTRVLEIFHERIASEGQARGSGARPTRRDRDRDKLHLAVGPQTGQLINLLVRNLVRPTVVELGTSFGYSTIWLSEAARAAGGRLITMENVTEKSARAQEMSAKAGLSEVLPENWALT